MAARVVCMGSREQGGSGRAQVTCDTAAKWRGSDLPVPLLQETSMAKLTSLEDLLVHELQDIYDAEGQIVKALPRMIKAASHQELQAAFEEHLEQTEGQIERLDQAFKLLGMQAKGEKCEGMAGLIEEGKKMMEEDANPAVMDAALISAAQKIE